nr:hypothetical protein [Tanacetum cinerariifolium]
MLDSKAYNEYYNVAFRAEPPKAKTKYKKKASEPVTFFRSKSASASKGAKLKSKAKVTKPDMKKQPVKKTKAKGFAVLSELALSEAEQIKLATKRSKKDFHISHASGSGNGIIPGVPDVPLYESKSDKESWGDSKDEDDNDDDGDNDDNGESDDHDDDSDDERTESDSDEIPYPNLTNVDQTEYEEEDVDEGVRTLCENEKADEHVQSSSVSFDFTSKFLNLENPYLVENEIASLMETLAPHATVIFEITSGFTTTTPPPPPFFNPFLQQQTPTITTPTFTTITSINPTVTLSEIPNFIFVFKFDQRVSELEFEMSELKQTNEPGIVDKYLASKMKEAVNVVDSTKKTIIKDQVKAQVSKIMPKIKKYVTESLGAEVLVRSTNQPQIAYAVAASLLEFELKKILIEKMEANKSINRPDTQKNLYNALVESYNSDKDIITSYGDVVLLKRGRDDQDKDKDPSAGSDRGTKRRKSGMQQDQEFVTGDNDEQPIDKEVTKVDWFKKPGRPLTLDPDRITRLTIMKKYDYGHLEEIEVLRDDQQLYTFKECDFKRLSLQDIKDILLLLIQRKLTNLTIDERDGTLNDVRTALHDIAVGIRMEYLLMQKWSNLDKKRARVMVQDIEKQLYQRRLMRNLEMFVGGRIYEKDLRLLERTI